MSAALWDHTTAGTERTGLYLLRRGGVEVATLAFLPEVDLPDVRVAQVVALFNRLDAEVDSDARYRAAGWRSRAEHDAAWQEVRLRAHGQEPAVRAYLNDRWRLDGLGDPARHPLSREVYEQWLDVMHVACEAPVVPIRPANPDVPQPPVELPRPADRPAAEGQS